MYCKKCGTKNENDALFCKQCGANLVMEYKDDDYQSLEKNNNKKKKQNPNERRVKTKTKVKNKVKKVKSKPSKQRGKHSKDDVIVERKMGLFSKIVMFFLILLVFALIVICGGLGYKLYTDNNIEVPNVVSMTYEEAYKTLKSKELNVEEVFKKVDDDTYVGIVLEQNKKPAKKVSKNTVIKVTVGVLDDTEITMINVVGMNIDKAKNSLNSKNILYKISYQEVDNGLDDIVLKQSVDENTKIKKGEVISLVVSKVNKSIEKENTSDTKTDESDSEDDISSSNDLDNNE